MFKTVNLELSLKPFKKTDEQSIREVCRGVFEQWRPLLKNRETVSVMLWTADGSEILDYAGDMNDTFEWCYYLGTANHKLIDDDERKDMSIHLKKQLYMPNPPVMTYGILKTIVSMLKQEGQKAFPNATIRVGETFDIGPEFAVSDFKYRRHLEITSGTRLDGFGFIDSTALLNADDRRYAAYPDGIPDKTPFGTFLGKQSSVFLRDMGFDYLWLSNGLGFSADPWDTTGKLFDGKDFHVENLDNTRKKVFEFWKLFREACPDFPLETRGTNNSVGIDYATDGVPLYDLYNAGLNITPPPNSPWAALNDNFGLEIMGHMTRVCELPCDGFMFRYYIHDPWWINSPWYDRYNGYPHDIYLPMAVSRIKEDGSVQSAEMFNILSIDNSFGNMPDNCVNEPLPHILKAEKDAADRPAPLVWVYPMREFTTSDTEDALYEMYYGDTFVSEAINHGLPLNCVVSSDIFLKTELSLYSQSIIISPYQMNEAVRARLEEYEKMGGKIIYYASREKLHEICGKVKVDIASAPAALREALENYGVSIRFDCKKNCKKPPAMTITRNNNAFVFSVYNPDTTTDTLLKFSLGAPIFTGGETEIINGASSYRFPRADHRECRVFVEQNGGVVSMREWAPVNNVHHRKVFVEGLEDATVCIFPESHCLETARIAEKDYHGDCTPVYDDRFTVVHDEQYGTFLRGEHISGDIELLMPYKNNKLGSML